MADKIAKEKSGPVEVKQYPKLPRVIDRIEYLRGGDPQFEFAKKIGLDPAEYSRMKNGKIKITDKTIKKIAEATGAPFDWIKGDQEEKTEKDTVDKASIKKPEKKETISKYSLQVVGIYDTEDIHNMIRGLIDGYIYRVSIKIETEDSI